MLRGAPQTTVTASSKDETPFHVRAGFQNLSGHFRGYEEFSGGVHLAWRLHVLERILSDDSASLRRPEKLFGSFNGSARSPVGIFLAQEDQERVSVGSGDVLDVFLCAEEFDQPSF